MAAKNAPPRFTLPRQAQAARNPPPGFALPPPQAQVQAAKRAPPGFPALPRQAPQAAAPASQSDPLLSAFDMIGELGAGGCGTVYMVRHRGTSKLFALKVGHESDVHTTSEAVMLRRCAASPFIVQCHSSLFSASGDVVLLLELMDAGSLDCVLRRRGCGFSEPAIAHVAVQCLVGLSFMHLRRMVHLDVKPANILANATGRVKLSDLGFAKALLDPRSGDQRSFSAGTAAYFSPERFTFDPYAHCDACAADIWSLGITLLELFSGCCPTMNPGEPPSWDSLIQTICFEPAPSLPEDAASKEFRGFLSLCLQKDPKKRPTAVELLNHPFAAWGSQTESLHALRETIRESHCGNSC